MLLATNSGEADLYCRGNKTEDNHARISWGYATNGGRYVL